MPDDPSDTTRPDEANNSADNASDAEAPDNLSITDEGSDREVESTTIRTSETVEIDFDGDGIIDEIQRIETVIEDTDGDGLPDRAKVTQFIDTNADGVTDITVEEET